MVLDPEKPIPLSLKIKWCPLPGGFSASSWQAFFQAAFGFMPPLLRLHAASPSAGRLLTLVAALPVKKEGEGVRREQGAWNAMCRELGTEAWSGSPKPKLWLPEKKFFYALPRLGGIMSAPTSRRQNEHSHV